MSDPVASLNDALRDRYSVQRKLGEGGMATVYLAEDLRHHRRVALKVMKPELTAVVGGERFLAEIETTANLTHPHILPLHDSGEVDGHLFYVMPYVEGETLREKLDRERQLPVDEAVRVARDLAEALDYAHRHGIIHRDIKPANILIHEGRPLIADFGIALAVGAAGGPRVTETGLSLGTPHYMSPEQATGDQHVGPPSDIYALGALLYEMLVGEPPYTGATAQAVLGKIIAGGEVSATRQRPSIPPNVDAAIRKALEQLPADRFASAREFGAALVDPGFRHGATDEAAGAERAGRWRRAAVGAGSVALLLALALAWQVTRPAEPGAVARYGIAFPPGQRLNDLTASTFTLTPDASAIVYVGEDDRGDDRQLWVKARDRLAAEPLAGTGGALNPSVSPDGQWIAYQMGLQLRKVPLVGGASITLTDSMATGFRGPAWLDEETLVYSGLGWHLRRVPAGGGTSERIWTPPEGRFAFGSTGLPGGTAVLFTLCDGGCAELQETWALDLDTGDAHRIAVGGIWATYVPSGHVVYVRPDGNAFAVPFDLGTLQASDSPVPVAEGVKTDGVAADLAVSTDGTLLMLSGGALSTQAEFVWVGRDGSVDPVDPEWRFDPGPNNRGWALSPDDRRLAFRQQTDAGFDIWIRELRPGGPLSRLTFDPGEDRKPQWTPDGARVTFLSERGGDLDLWERRADGTGEARLVYDHDVFLAHAFYAPDGRTAVLRTGGVAGAEGGRDILVVDPERDSAATPLLAAEYDEWAPAVSPDGRWLAYSSEETGQNEVFIRPFPDVDSGKWQASSGGGALPLWAHGGRELFYIGAENRVMAARVETEPSFRVVDTRALFELDETFLVATTAGMWDLTSDDQRFLMARAARTDDEPTQMVLVQNWFEELETLIGR